MLLDKVYKLECVAVNSLGWDLKFRDCKLSCKIEKGEGMMDILPNSENNILYFSLTGKGEIRILLNSKYSLNPTIISLNSR
jgi:hypothetical protein